MVRRDLWTRSWRHASSSWGQWSRIAWQWEHVSLSRFSPASVSGMASLSCRHRLKSRGWRWHRASMPMVAKAMVSEDRPALPVLNQCSSLVSSAAGRPVSSGSCRAWNPSSQAMVRRAAMPAAAAGRQADGFGGFVGGGPVGGYGVNDALMQQFCGFPPLVRAGVGALDYGERPERLGPVFPALGPVFGFAVALRVGQRVEAEFVVIQHSPDGLFGFLPGFRG